MIRLFSLALLLAPTLSAQTVYGDPLPLASDAFESVDGSRLALDQAMGTAGLVVVFWSNTCPWTERYAPRLADLVSTYAPADIGFVLVNANDPSQNERESDAASREMISRAGLAVPYLRDSGRLADVLGVQSAPHAFFFGPDATLLYDGALDDSPASADRVRAPYLAQAMDASVAGLPIEVQRTQAIGCTIKRAGE